MLIFGPWLSGRIAYPGFHGVRFSRGALGMKVKRTKLKDWRARFTWRLL